MNAVDNLVNLIDQLQNVESSITRLMTEIIMKLCSLTSSSVLLVVENNQVRRICGTGDLKTAYRDMTLKPLPSDLEVLVDLSNQQSREEPFAPQQTPPLILNRPTNNTACRKRSKAAGSSREGVDDTTLQRKKARTSPEPETFKLEMFHSPRNSLPSNSHDAFDVKLFPGIASVELNDCDSDIEILDENASQLSITSEDYHCPAPMSAGVPLLDVAVDAQFQAKADALRQIDDPFLPFTKVISRGLAELIVCFYTILISATKRNLFHPFFAQGSVENRLHVQ